MEIGFHCRLRHLMTMRTGDSTSDPAQEIRSRYASARRVLEIVNQVERNKNDGTSVIVYTLKPGGYVPLNLTKVNDYHRNAFTSRNVITSGGIGNRVGGGGGKLLVLPSQNLLPQSPMLTEPVHVPTTTTTTTLRPPSNFSSGGGIPTTPYPFGQRGGSYDNRSVTFPTPGTFGERNFVFRPPAVNPAFNFSAGRTVTTSTNTTPVFNFTPVTRPLHMSSSQEVRPRTTTNFALGGATRPPVVTSTILTPHSTPLGVFGRRADAPSTNEYETTIFRPSAPRASTPEVTSTTTDNVLNMSYVPTDDETTLIADRGFDDYDEEEGLHGGEDEGANQKENPGVFRKLFNYFGGDGKNKELSPEDILARPFPESSPPEADLSATGIAEFHKIKIPKLVIGNPTYIRSRTPAAKNSQLIDLYRKYLEDRIDKQVPKFESLETHEHADRVAPVNTLEMVACGEIESFLQMKPPNPNALYEYGSVALATLYNNLMTRYYKLAGQKTGDVTWSKVAKQNPLLVEILTCNYGPLVVVPTKNLTTSFFSQWIMGHGNSAGTSATKRDTNLLMLFWLNCYLVKSNHDYKSVVRWMCQEFVFTMLRDVMDGDDDDAFSILTRPTDDLGPDGIALFRRHRTPLQTWRYQYRDKLERYMRMCNFGDWSADGQYTVYLVWQIVRELAMAVKFKLEEFHTDFSNRRGDELTYRQVDAYMTILIMLMKQRHALVCEKISKEWDAYNKSMTKS